MKVQLNFKKETLGISSCFFFSFSDFTEETSFQYPEENTDSKIKDGRKSPGYRKEHLSCRCLTTNHRTILMNYTFFLRFVDFLLFCVGFFAN